MKKILLVSGLFAGLFTGAQDCKNFLFMTNNAEVQMTVYDKKGKESGIQTWTITEVKKDGSGYHSTINSSFKDEKGKEAAAGKGLYKCTGGILQADMKMSMPQQQMEAYKDAAVKFEPAYLEYPPKMNEGQSLADADFKMDVEMKGGMTTNIGFKQTNRKVGSKESVTSPAGTWDAYIITYDAQLSTRMAGINIPINFNFTGKEWFVPNVGIVKTETYAKGGKLLGSSLITSIKK